MTTSTSNSINNNNINITTSININNNKKGMDSQRVSYYFTYSYPNNDEQHGMLLGRSQTTGQTTPRSSKKKDRLGVSVLLLIELSQM